MSSPFTFPSPFPPAFLVPSPSPLAAPSPLAGILAQFPGQSPAPLFSGLNGLGSAGTPQTHLSLPQGQQGTSAYGGPAPSSRGAATGAPSDVELDSVLSGIEEALRVLGRLEQVLEMIQLDRASVFEGRAGTEVEDGDMAGVNGSPGRIMALQQEYAQILLSLQPLLTSTLLGALPVPLTAALPSPSSTSTSPGEKPIPTITELTAWAEKRAELEFSRREGVRAGAKAVLDTLRTRQYETQIKLYP